MRTSKRAATRRFLLIAGAAALALTGRTITSDEAAEPNAPVDPRYEAVAQYISPEAWAEMVPFQQQMLVNLANRRAASDAALAGQKKRPALVACWEYGGEPIGREIEHAFNTVAPNGDLDAFRLRGTFWEETATDGPGLVRGDQMTFTWGFVADGLSIPGFNGEPTSNSNLIAFLDTLYDPGHTGGADLTQRLWFARFQQVLTTWSNWIGTEYVYEPNDDGAAFMTAPGLLGVRADMRVGGHFIDGEVGTNILAYNFYPHVGGDMVIDTGNPTFFGDGTNNSRGLRNVLAHEHGHGIGLAHVCSTDRDFLMEPFINVTFDGPQEDDILSAHRLFGESSEFPDGNDSAADYDARFAVSAGHNHNIFALGGPWSIDGTSDVDVFAFDLVDADSLVTISVTPFGTTYDEGPQVGGTCTSNGPFNAAAQNDLVLELIEFDGTPIVTADANGAGLGETISGFPIANPGLVYYRVSGNIDAAQRYDWGISIVPDPAASPPRPTASSA